MAQGNKQVLLAARPSGWPSETDFRIVESPLPAPGDEEVLVQVLWLSVDPYMRGRMRDAPSYADPVPLGGVMTGGGVGRVVESRHQRFRAGDIVAGVLGWQQWAAVPGKDLRRIDPALAPISTALSVLGMPGLTAYFGLFDICAAKPGETVVVSGAAGAVGSQVGQLARIHGCRVVGIAGTDDKVRWLLDDLGFDAAFNYKTETRYRAKLAELCPGGIDCYFDNVGGPITDAVLMNLALRARIAICGQIAGYNSETPDMGPRLLFNLIIKRARMEGFLVFDFAERYKEGLTRMAGWLQEGKLKYRESVVEGIENAPRAFLGMMRGENTGKQLVRIAPE